MKLIDLTMCNKYADIGKTHCLSIEWSRKFITIENYLIMILMSTIFVYATAFSQNRSVKSKKYLYLNYVIHFDENFYLFYFYFYSFLSISKHKLLLN